MASRDTNRPNIVLILADDQGAWAMGCSGNSEINTPNMDRLAATGVRFSNFFCTSPVCSPARASILTGRIPSQHGVHDWIRAGNVDKENLPEEIRDYEVFRDEKKTIAYLEDQPAYTEVLADNGYVCGLSGKWHLGDSIRPQKGFSHWFTIARGGCDYNKSDLVREGTVVIEKKYITDVITEDALNYIEERQEDNVPFYLSVHYTAPHTPWDRDQHPQDIFESYDSCPFESVPEEEPHPWQIPTCCTGTGEKRKELLKGYYTAITAMDKGIGQIIDKIEELGMRENTIIVFTSDNGMNTGHHGIWGKGNGTFPQNMFDTSVKVPAIISRPGHIQEGQVCDSLLSHYDFMPTLLDYLGMENLQADCLPGKSFARILEGEQIQERENVVVFDEYGPVRMVRTKEWKYVHRYPYGPNELYNLINDPSESINLVDKPGFDEVIISLKSKLENWFFKYVDPTKDGTKEAVTGFGQLCFAGIKGEGQKIYKTHDRL